jgi:stage III sporulation protein AD
MLALTVRRERPEFAVMISLVTSVIILAEVTKGVEGIIGELRTLIEESGVDIKYFTMALKAVGMAYIAQFAAEILRDSGENVAATKVEAAGKICILALTMPVMTSFLQLCVKVVNGI